MKNSFKTINNKFLTTCLAVVLLSLAIIANVSAQSTSNTKNPSLFLLNQLPHHFGIKTSPSHEPAFLHAQMIHTTFGIDSKINKPGK